MNRPGPSPSESPLLDELAGQTALVTGGAGFIGSHISAALAGRVDLKVVDTLSTGTLANVPGDAQFIHGNIGSEPVLRLAIDDVDVVFHHAAEVSVPASIDRPVEYHETNVRGTLRLLEAARAAEARVVLASSAAIYGEPSQLPIPEDEPPTPSTPYGATKLAADCYSRVYGATYGLETVALRYFNVYGPRQQPGGDGGVVATFIDRGLRGEPLVVHGDGRQTRDFVHIDDVVRANLAAAAVDDWVGAYNIGTGVGSSVLELARRVREHVPTPVEIRHGDARDGDIRHSRADISRATSDLQFEARVALEDGLAALRHAVPSVETAGRG